MDSKDSDQTEWIRRVDMSQGRADILYLGENVTRYSYLMTKPSGMTGMCAERVLRSVGKSSSLESLLAVNLEMLWNQLVIECSLRTCHFVGFVIRVLILSPALYR